MKAKKRGIFISCVCLLCLLSCVCLFGCGGGGSPETPPETPPDGAKQFTDITFTDKTVTYDGTEHSIVIAGELSNGTKVDYTNNTGTDAGVYNATAALSGEGYESKTLTAKLTVNKADIPADGITFADGVAEYDGKPHTLQIVGNLPQGVVCEYLYDGEKTDGATTVGSHTVQCILSGKNYNTVTLDAKLTITSTEKQLYSAAMGNTVYFQNGLDGDTLYAVDGTAPKKISKDVPNYMIATNDSLYYFGTSMFSKVIKQYKSNASTTLYSQSGEYLATDNDNNLYYAVNNLLWHTDLNGIYKVAVTGSSEPVRLTTDKAKYLVYCGGYIYYANASEHYYLYRISVNANAQKGELLREEGVADLLSDGSAVYFNSTKKVAGVVGVASAVCKYIPSQNKFVKLTKDSGKYLVKVGDFIYYVNNDVLTSAVYGDGIYRVNANLSSDSDASGERVLQAEGNGYSSLASDGTSLYYYKMSNKHFCKYVVGAQTETDLMQNFVPPEEETVLTGYSNVATYNKEVYYTDPTDGSSLYKYNPTTKARFKVLADSVSKMYFNGEYMYYNTYIATNYAFWRMRLTDGEIEKLSSGRWENLAFDGDDIYGVKMGATSNDICKFNIATKAETTVYDKKPPNVVGFEKVGNDFYFIMNPAVGYQYIYKYNGATQSAAELNGIKAKHLTVLSDTIYYYGSDDTLSVCDLNGENIRVLKEKVEINDLYAMDGKVYFSSVSKDNTGFYVYDIASGSVTAISDKPANGIVKCDGKIYFLCSCVSYTKGYPTQKSGLDGCLYCYDGSTVKKV